MRCRILLRLWRDFWRDVREALTARWNRCGSDIAEDCEYVRRDAKGGRIENSRRIRSTRQ